MIILNSLLLRKPRRNAEKRKNLLQEPENFLQNPGNSLAQSGNLLQEPENFLQNPGHLLQEPENLLQEPENLLQEPGKTATSEAPHSAEAFPPFSFEQTASETEAMTPAWKSLFNTSDQDGSRENRDFFHTGETTLLPVLEKICSLLEQIAESVENCSRKLDSEENDELKYN